MRLDRLYGSITDNSKAGSVRKAWREHLGIDEAEPSRGRVSWLSPWARALLGRDAGDEVTLRTPKGEEQWEITDVRWG